MTPSGNYRTKASVRSRRRKPPKEGAVGESRRGKPFGDKKARRTNLIHLTKDGKELEERARIIANQTLKEALQGITLEELSVSQEVLRKIFFNTKD